MMRTALVVMIAVGSLVLWIMSLVALYVFDDHVLAAVLMFSSIMYLVCAQVSAVIIS